MKLIIEFNLVVDYWIYVEKSINFLYVNNNQVIIIPICNTTEKYKIANNKTNKKYV